LENTEHLEIVLFNQKRDLEAVPTKTNYESADTVEAQLLLLSENITHLARLAITHLEEEKAPEPALELLRITADIGIRLKEAQDAWIAANGAP
jgi:hypothetical protein